VGSTLEADGGSNGVPVHNNEIESAMPLRFNWEFFNKIGHQRTLTALALSSFIEQYYHS
jgi:hypothetical protein